MHTHAHLQQQLHDFIHTAAPPLRAAKGLEDPSGSPTHQSRVVIYSESSDERNTHNLAAPQPTRARRNPEKRRENDKRLSFGLLPADKLLHQDPDKIDGVQG